MGHCLVFENLGGHRLIQTNLVNGVFISKLIQKYFIEPD